MHDLTLNEKHEYTLNGRRVPGVTEVIRHFLPHWDCGQWYLDRGKVVHLEIARAIQGKIDWATVDPRIKKRVEGIAKFVRVQLLIPVAVETSLGSSLCQFAGTLDFVGFGGAALALYDWKSSIDPATTLQLGGYAILWEENRGSHISKAIAVEVDDDGYTRGLVLKGHELREARNTFLNMLSLYHWKSKRGLIKAEGDKQS